MSVFGELERGVLACPALDGHEFAPADAGPGGEDVHHEVDVAAGHQRAPLSEAQGLEGVITFAVGVLGGPGRYPALDAHPAAAALASFGRVPLDLPGVHGVAEDRDQQGAGGAGHRPGVGAAAGADAGRDGGIPRLDLLELQRPELAALELRQDEALDEVLVLGARRRLDVAEHPDPDVDPVLEEHPAAGALVP